MPKLIERIYAPANSGKTTIAAALVHGYAQIGIHAAFIAPTEALAVGVAIAHKLPQSNVYGWSPELIRRGVLDRYQAIILDDAHLMTTREGHAMDLLTQRYQTSVVPFPAIVAFYKGKAGKHATA